MEELILNSYASKIHRLSPSVKAVLITPQTGDTVEAVCQKHNVGNRVFSYSGLIGLILMGELSPNLLVKSIVEKEGIDTEKAKYIAMDLSAAIFQPIKQELVAMYGLTPKPVAPPMSTQTEQVLKTPLAPPEAPSTREAGTSLPPIPAPSVTSIPAPVSTPIMPIQPPTSSDKMFYSPPASPTLPPAGVSPKPNIIDLSKEPSRPVAQLGDPPLEGNIVNLKDISNKPTT